MTMRNSLTVTIHSNLFGVEVNDDDLKKIATAYYNDFKSLLVEYDLDEGYETEAYWIRGCIIEYFTVSILSGVAYKIVVDYDKLRVNLPLLCNDLRQITKKVGNVFVEIKQIYISKTTPHRDAKKIEESKDGINNGKPVEDEDSKKL